MDHNKGLSSQSGTLVSAILQCFFHNIYGISLGKQKPNNTVFQHFHNVYYCCHHRTVLKSYTFAIFVQEILTQPLPLLTFKQQMAFTVGNSIMTDET